MESHWNALLSYWNALLSHPGTQHSHLGTIESQWNTLLSHPSTRHSHDPVNPSHRSNIKNSYASHLGHTVSFNDGFPTHHDAVLEFNPQI